jgi:hypothetical protein
MHAVYLVLVIFSEGLLSGQILVLASLRLKFDHERLT